jgi:hypothetical protein
VIAFTAADEARRHPPDIAQGRSGGPSQEAAMVIVACVAAWAVVESIVAVLLVARPVGRRNPPGIGSGRFDLNI